MQHPGMFLKSGSETDFTLHLKKVIEIAHQCHRRLQSLPIIGLHGVQRPAFDKRSIELCKMFQGVADQLITELNLNGGDTPCPVE